MKSHIPILYLLIAILNFANIFPPTDASAGGRVVARIVDNGDHCQVQQQLQAVTQYPSVQRVTVAPQAVQQYQVETIQTPVIQQQIVERVVQAPQYQYVQPQQQILYSTAPTYVTPRQTVILSQRQLGNGNNHHHGNAQVVARVSANNHHHNQQAIQLQLQQQNHHAHGGNTLNLQTSSRNRGRPANSSQTIRLKVRT